MEKASRFFYCWFLGLICRVTFSAAFLPVSLLRFRPVSKGTRKIQGGARLAAGAHHKANLWVARGKPGASKGVLPDALAAAGSSARGNEGTGALAAAASHDLISRRFEGSQRALTAAGIVFFGLIVCHTAIERMTGHQWKGMHRRHDQLVAAGKMLDRSLADDAWIAATNVGRIPYFARRRTVDMMGLNDAHIGRVDLIAAPELAGHLKGDGGYVLDRAPEVIFFLRLVVRDEPLAGRDWIPLARKIAFGVSEKQLLRDPRFGQQYRMYSIPLPEIDSWLNVFARPGAFDENPPPGLIEDSRSGR